MAGEEIAAAGVGAVVVALLNSEGFNRVYGDLAAPLAKQIGEFAGDCGKATRWLMPGIQFMAHNQDMLLKERIRQVNEEVEEELQIPALPSILFPVLESLSRQEEGNPLAKLYMNLLKRAIDRDRVNEAHPAFCNIINQLSGDEAILLLMAWKETTKMPHPRGIAVLQRLNLKNLLFENHAPMYVEHLRGLQLLAPARETIHSNNNHPPHIAKGNPGPNIYIDRQRLRGHIEFTEFGKLFCTACLPDELHGVSLEKPNGEAE